ncbi:PilW family protein [Hippea sp. KM1]|uniref:PilW family protein n=1 Tax=Hippea sp. KM1 TaxID=944481 RepID=UPI00046D67D9|nr:type II secretion system protein [Hippea sp. KM1]
MGFNRSKIYNPKLQVSGFTLVELIITMVLVGIVAYLGSNLIMPVMEGYVDTQVKTLLFNEAQYAASRMAIELRNAIPNTVKVLSNSEIEFAEFSDAGYYSPLQNSDNITCIGINVAANDYVSIYNTKPDYFYSDNKSIHRVYTIKDIQGGRCILNKNIIKDSPYHRIYKIGKIVKFYLKDRKIYRDSVDFPNKAKIEEGGYIMANYIKSLKFTYMQGFTFRQAVLKIELVMRKGDVELTYNQEVHIRNVP